MIITYFETSDFLKYRFHTYRMSHWVWSKFKWVQGHLNGLSLLKNCKVQQVTSCRQSKNCQISKKLIDITAIALTRGLMTFILWYFWEIYLGSCNWAIKSNFSNIFCQKADSPKMEICISKINLILPRLRYCKVASSKKSHLEAHAGYFRSFWQKVDFLISNEH